MMIMLNSLVGMLYTKKCRMIILGLDNAGESAILLNNLALHNQPLPTESPSHLWLQHVNVPPTIAFNSMPGISEDKTHIARHLLEYHCQLVDAVIFVVDSIDNQRIFEARDEFHQVLAQATTSRCFKNVFDRLSGKAKARKIYMVGLANAGKTSTLYKFKFHEATATVPTIGFNVETFKYNKILFTAWDFSGREQLRALWRYYFDNTTAV
ncbi:hypothetical protein DYB35_000752 [Aphanomyces astaci]|uniref:Uncharacterized protein n=1 Tax=Aphanomyces astaci TaxID=112090 RepID=A0A418DK31_APHAT|nr:hypothetical protein DYB35_000752 [Aphanomyces astaci]